MQLKMIQSHCQVLGYTTVIYLGQSWETLIIRAQFNWVKCFDNLKS